MQRRDILRSLFVLSLPGSLAACGGGGGGSGGKPTTPPDTTPPDTTPPQESDPKITQFSSDKASYFIGEPAILTAAFDKGTGIITPGQAAITNGAPLTLPRLTSKTLTLTVRAPSASNPAVFREAQRTLQVDLKYRNQWQAFDAGFTRASHVTVAADNGSLYVIGGDGGGGALPRTVFVFDPYTERFSDTGSILGGRVAHAAAVLKTGDILIVGGSRSVPGTPSAELFSPAAKQSRATAGQPRVNRQFHTATLLANGKVLLLGGQATGESYLSASADLYDPATEQFTRLDAAMQYGRVQHNATLLANGKVLITGGTNSTNAALPPELFDPQTQTFTTLSLPAGETLSRYHHLTFTAASGDTFVVGGTEFTSDQPYDSVMKYAKDTNAASMAGKLLTPRTEHAGAPLLDGRILVCGGINGLASKAIASTELYDTATGQTVAGPDMSTVRMQHTANLLVTGKVLVIGGNTTGIAVSSMAELFG